MLYREIMEEMIQWKNSNDKRALFLVGARQIGKTFIVREFAKEHYKNFIELNFIEDQNASTIFDGDLSADVILTNISAYKMQTIVPGETLIFFDEIQECPNARTAIKFLVDDGRYDYIESGSLLGVKYHEVKSYPVGYEKKVQMYPINFREFCIANKMPENIFLELERAYHSKKAVTETIHNKMLELFYTYIIVGGMPDVVQRFIDTRDIAQVVDVQKDILELYRQDISKYALDKEKTKVIFDLIPSELNEKNRRFKFSDIDKNARVSRYESALNWLVDAGVALPCYNLEEPVIPLEINQKSNLFKLFLADTGLLCASSIENVQYDILKGNVDINMGSILENMFAQIFVESGFKLRYFQNKKIELDFILQSGKDVLPIEIKSGNDYKKHSSLNQALSVANWKFERGIVFCKGNLEVEDSLLYLPWYMAMFFKPNIIQKSLIAPFSWEV